MTDPEMQSADAAAAPAGPAIKPKLLVRLRAACVNWLGLNVPDQGPKSADELARLRTDLAESRTLMAADRTLMAWIRTSLSLNSFGFTIYKILEGFQAAGTDLPEAQTPRNIGLFLTGLATFAMVMGTVEYWQTLKELRQLQEFKLLRPSLIMATVMSFMGVFLFFSIVTKLF